MKSIITILLAITFSVIVMGQSTQEKQQKFEGIKRYNGINTQFSSNDDLEFAHYQINARRSDLHKSTLANKQSLDSLIIETGVDGSNKMKFEWTYNADENLTMEFDFVWDETSNHWITSSKKEFTYDVNGNLTLDIAYNWDESSSQLIADNKNEYTYDDNGNNTLSILSLWDESTGQWTVFYKYESTFDANGNNTLFVGNKWDESTSQWLFKFKYEYIFDANGNNTLFVGNKWDNSTDQWIATYKYEYTYDVNGNDILNFDYNWDESTSQWIATDKYELTYDTNGKNTLYIRYNLDESTVQWIATYKNEKTFDANGNNTLVIGYFKDENTGQLIATSKNQITYDLSYIYADLILPTNGYVWNLTNKPIEESGYSWDETNSNWINDGKLTYYYSEHNGTSVNTMGMVLSNIYPNPASKYISFNFTGNNTQVSFELFDMQGRKVMTKEVKNAEIISLEDLHTGIYFYKLFMDGQKQSGKLIKN